MHYFVGFPFGGIPLLDTTPLKVAIVHTTNTGTAWGLLSSFQTLLLVFRLLITAGLLSYLLFFKPAKHLQMPLTLIAAGALGNIVSMIVWGHVVDLISLIFYRYSYPIFNVADSAIFCSVAYLLLTSMKKRKVAGASRN